MASDCIPMSVCLEAMQGFVFWGIYVYGKTVKLVMFRDRWANLSQLFFTIHVFNNIRSHHMCKQKMQALSSTMQL